MVTQNRRQIYLFAGVAVASALMVISCRNPVHSVLFLILTFVNAAGLFILTGAEFLGLLLIVVYVGAVAVLFLFVVMMLDVDFAELREGYLQYLPVGGLIGLIVLAELLIVVGGWIAAPSAGSGQVAPIPDPDITRNIEALGNILYTDYIFFFQMAKLKDNFSAIEESRYKLLSASSSLGDALCCSQNTQPRDSLTQA